MVDLFELIGLEYLQTELAAHFRGKKWGISRDYPNFA
jgi:hypothetical protein